MENTGRIHGCEWINGRVNGRAPTEATDKRIIQICNNEVRLFVRLYICLFDGLHAPRYPIHNTQHPVLSCGVCRRRAGKQVLWYVDVAGLRCEPRLGV